MSIDQAWLAMRTLDGATIAQLSPAPGVAEWLLSEGLAVSHGERISPTLRGFLLADRIAARIVQCWQ
jgi:hypothetical protein